MSGTTNAPNWYDPNLFAPGGGGNPDTNQGNVGYGSVDTLGQFAGAVGGGLSTVLGGPLGLINLGTALGSGQAPSVQNTVSQAKGALTSWIGGGDDSTGDSGQAQDFGSAGPANPRDGERMGTATQDMAQGGAVEPDDDHEDMHRTAHGALFHAMMLQHHMNRLRDRHPGALHAAFGGSVG